MEIVNANIEAALAHGGLNSDDHVRELLAQQAAAQDLKLQEQLRAQDENLKRNYGMMLEKFKDDERKVLEHQWNNNYEQLKNQISQEVQGQMFPDQASAHSQPIPSMLFQSNQVMMNQQDDEEASANTVDENGFRVMVPKKSLNSSAVNTARIASINRRMSRQLRVNKQVDPIKMNLDM